jgi:hypothetical protein
MDKPTLVVRSYLYSLIIVAFWLLMRFVWGLTTIGWQNYDIYFFLVFALFVFSIIWILRKDRLGFWLGLLPSAVSWIGFVSISPENDIFNYLSIFMVGIFSVVSIITGIFAIADKRKYDDQIQDNKTTNISSFPEPKIDPNQWNKTMRTVSIIFKVFFILNSILLVLEGLMFREASVSSGWDAFGNGMAILSLLFFGIPCFLLILSIIQSIYLTIKIQTRNELKIILNKIHVYFSIFFLVPCALLAIFCIIFSYKIAFTLIFQIAYVPIFYFPILIFYFFKRNRVTQNQIETISPVNNLP